jgi:hypothetical protein
MLLSLNPGSVYLLERKRCTSLVFTEGRTWHLQYLKKKQKDGHGSLKNWRTNRRTDVTSSIPEEETEGRTRQPQELTNKQKDGHGSLKSWTTNRRTDTAASRVEQQTEGRTRQPQELKKRENVFKIVLLCDFLHFSDTETTVVYVYLRFV